MVVVIYSQLFSILPVSLATEHGGFSDCRAFVLKVFLTIPFKFQISHMGSGASSKVAPDFGIYKIPAKPSCKSPAPHDPWRFSSFTPNEFVVDLPPGVNLPPNKDDHDRHLRNLSGYLKKVRRSPNKLIDKVDRKRGQDQRRYDEVDRKMSKMVSETNSAPTDA